MSLHPLRMMFESFLSLLKLCDICHHCVGLVMWGSHLRNGLFTFKYSIYGASLVAQMVKTLPTRREARVQSLGQEDLLEGEMATHSSTLAWEIPWTEELGGLQSMGSLRVGHDRATSLSLFTFMHWRRKWQPTPVFLPGESQGWRSLVGCSPWGR